MTLNVNLVLCRQCYAYYDKMAEVKILWFSLKVALYLSYLHIKLDDETQRILQIPNIIWD